MGDMVVVVRSVLLLFHFDDFIMVFVGLREPGSHGCYADLFDRMRNPERY